MAKASTTLGGLTFTARANGGSGNLIGISVGISNLPTFAYASGSLITIVLQHDGVALTTSTSTRADVEAAVQANPGVDALIESSVGDGTIFPYTNPPIGYTYLTGGSETLIGDVVVTPSLRATRIRPGSLAGAVTAVATLVAVTLKGGAAAVVGTSTATGTVDLVAGAASNVVGTSNAQATASSTISMQAAAQGSTIVVASAGVVYAAASQAIGVSGANASATIIRTSLTICDVIRDILLAWGIEQPCSAPSMTKLAALNILNQSMQTLWNQAKDRNYWTQSTLNLTITGGSSTQILTDTIQNVVGPARLSTGETLVPLANISELENFQNSFLEASSANAPCAYYIERNFQSGDDPARCTLMLVPTPVANVTVNIDVVTEAPRYTILDFDTCPVCPIPHKYVESLLLPVCRYLAMHSHLFIMRERADAIMQGYAQARMLLDVADPLPGLSGENAKFRKEGDKS